MLHGHKICQIFISFIIHMKRSKVSTVLELINLANLDDK